MFLSLRTFHDDASHDDAGRSRAGLRRLLTALAIAPAVLLVARVGLAQSPPAGTVPPQPGSVVLPAGAAGAAAAPLPQRDWYDLQNAIRRQQEQIEAQAQQLRQQAQWLESYRQALEQQRRELELVQQWMVQAQGAAAAPGTAVVPAAQGPSAPGPRPGAEVAGGQGKQAEGQPTPVGEPAPREERPTEVAGVREAGGVLTPRGVLVVEPSIQYSQSSINRFFFQGIEIVETVLIGEIEATDSDRDTVIGAAALRYGVTNRFEVEAKVPVVDRDDRVVRQVVSTAAETTRSLDVTDIGDVEASARYQVNSGAGGWPIFVANLRAKSDTGVGPFDVARDDEGIETELPTGSGFWAVQPGVTALVPSDPAVFFANVNYLVHIGRDIDQLVGDNMIGHVDPGDVFGFSLGMGIGLNEQTSFSIGYGHDFVGETTTEIDGVDVDSETLDVGSLLFGFSYAVSQAVAVNLNVQAGITADAPDITITLRVPIRFQVN